MRAVVITGQGGPEVLEIRDLPTPTPGFGQIRVRVYASSANRADISQRLGRYPAPPGFPQDVPGLEYAGEIDSLGPGTSMWRVGARVMGLIAGGGHAEFVCVHERETMAIPDGMDWESAAAIPEVFVTAYDAIRQLDVHSGEALLIHAVGSGVGTAAVQLARVSGIRSIGTSRTAEKLRRASDLGLDSGVDASDPAWPDEVLRVTDGGVHAILDLVGGAYLAGNISVLRPLGRMIVVGLTAGGRAELDMVALLRKRLRILGTVLRSRPLEEKIAVTRQFAELMLPLFSAGRLKPVVESVHSFDEIQKVHALMESNSTFGKLVLRWV